MKSEKYKTNKVTRFVLPFILPDKTLLSKEYGFVNAYTRTVLKKTTIVLVFDYDLNNHSIIHRNLESLKHYKGCYQNLTFEMLEFNIPQDVYDIVEFILERSVYGLLSSEKLKIVNFWGDFSLSHMVELLKDTLEIDVLDFVSIKTEINNQDFYIKHYYDYEDNELADFINKT